MQRSKGKTFGTDFNAGIFGKKTTLNQWISHEAVEQVPKHSSLKQYGHPATNQ